MAGFLNKRDFNKMFFLEITGIFCLLFSVSVVLFLANFKFIPPAMLVIPAIGVLFIGAYVFVTMKFAHALRVHEIHTIKSHKYYHYRRIASYILAAVFAGLAVYLAFVDEDFVGDIGAVVTAEILIILAIYLVYYTYTLTYLIENEHLRHAKISFWDVFWVFLLPLGLVAGTVFFLFSQTASTVTEGKADFEARPAVLIAEFQKDSAAAYKKYLGKSIKFSGSVAEISGDSSVVVKLNAGIDEFVVNCGFDKSQKEKLSGVVIGDSIQLQCECSGITVPSEDMGMLTEKSLEMSRCNLLSWIKSKPQLGTDIETPLSRDTNQNK
ncbi:MAG: hypothetical protein JNL57_02680 [Bacteroidetes bacterium]|nr:hypothetical protein [Bacteroidota bacterium]